MKLVASFGIMRIRCLGHTFSAAQSPQPSHFSGSMMTLPYSSLIAPCLQTFTQSPTPQQPSLHSPRLEPASTKALQDSNSEALALPAEKPAQATKATRFLSPAAGEALVFITISLLFTYYYILDYKWFL